MKKLTATFLASSLVLGMALSSCNGDKAEKTQALVDSLQNVIAQQQDQLTESDSFVEFMNTTMDSVLISEGSILRGDAAEGVTPTRQQMKQNLEAYNKLLTRQKERIAELQKQLEKTNSANAAKMKEVIAKMQEQIDAKEAEIQELRAQLDDKNANIAQLESKVQDLDKNVNDLTASNQEKDETITAQTNKMNEGFYVMGTKKELKAKGLMSGAKLFTNSKLDLKTATEGQFTQVDIRTMKTLTIPAKSPKILTQAPTGSYTLTTNGKTSTLTITDATKFWSLSKYLVIQY